MTIGSPVGTVTTYTFGAHHGTASRPSFSRWTRVTFATQMWAAV